jgi:hypothetical protein
MVESAKTTGFLGGSVFSPATRSPDEGTRECPNGREGGNTEAPGSRT